VGEAVGVGGAEVEQEAWGEAELIDDEGVALGEMNVGDAVESMGLEEEAQKAGDLEKSKGLYAAGDDVGGQQVEEDESECIVIGMENRQTSEPHGDGFVHEVVVVVAAAAELRKTRRQQKKLEADGRLEEAGEEEAEVAGVNKQHTEGEDMDSTGRKK
jgi:hypothetical protein